VAVSPTFLVWCELFSSCVWCVCMVEELFSSCLVCVSAMAQTSMIPASHPQAHAMQRTPLADVLQQQQQHVLPQSTSSAHIQHPSQSIRSSSHMMPTQPMYRLPTYPHQKSMTQQQQAQQLHPQGHPQAHPRQSAMMSHHMTNSQSYPPTAAMPLPPMVHSRTPESRQHLDDLEAILPSM